MNFRNPREWLLLLCGVACGACGYALASGDVNVALLYAASAFVLHLAVD